MSSGNLTSSEAAELTKVIDTYTRALNVVDHEDRIARLEQTGGQRQRGGWAIANHHKRIERLEATRGLGGVEVLVLRSEYIDSPRCELDEQIEQAKQEGR